MSDLTRVSGLPRAGVFFADNRGADVESIVGCFNETETDEVSKHGNSYTGNNETKIYDLNGTLQVDLHGTASATRIPP